ncbi:MAG: DUF2278 family protein [Thermomicrobiales bacterium]
MPLSEGYGVVVGTVIAQYLEPESTNDPWQQYDVWIRKSSSRDPGSAAIQPHGEPHYVIWVDTRDGAFRCGANLKSTPQAKVLYRELALPRTMFDNLLGLPSGFHELAADGASGALDFIRDRRLQDDTVEWQQITGMEVVQRVQDKLKVAMRVLVFGEPYFSPLPGMHNIHMNQGDPVTIPQAGENGIWQDGGIVLEDQTGPDDFSPAPLVSVFLIKFLTQSLHTDDYGHPCS